MPIVTKEVQRVINRAVNYILPPRTAKRKMPLPKIYSEEAFAEGSMASYLYNNFDKVDKDKLPLWRFTELLQQKNAFHDLVYQKTLGFFSSAKTYRDKLLLEGKNKDKNMSFRATSNHKANAMDKLIKCQDGNLLLTITRLQNCYPQCKLAISKSRGFFFFSHGISRKEISTAIENILALDKKEYNRQIVQKQVVKLKK